jgi:hypothetical protein
MERAVLAPAKLLAVGAIFSALGGGGGGASESSGYSSLLDYNSCANRDRDRKDKHCHRNGGSSNGVKCPPDGNGHARGDNRAYPHSPATRPCG